MENIDKIINDTLDDATMALYLQLYIMRQYEKLGKVEVKSVSYNRDTKTGYATIYFKPVLSAEYININFNGAVV